MTAHRMTVWIICCDHEAPGISGPVRCGAQIEIEADTLLIATQIAHRKYQWRPCAERPAKNYCPRHAQLIQQEGGP